MPLAFLIEAAAELMKPSTGVLTVDLAAIQENWRRVNRQLHGSTTSAAVIKANAYGLGASQVGPALFAAGCREFFVATLEEAIAARSYLSVAATIYVLGGARAGAEKLFIQHQLTPVLFSYEDFGRWQQFCAVQNLRGTCAVKVDTGMTRLGLDINDFLSLCRNENGFEHLDVSLVMSHLACADETGHPLNMQQLQAFQCVVDEAKVALPSARFSLANSSGVFLGPQWHFDLVRPGASLYGINPRPESISPVKPVIHLQLPILQIRRLGQTVTLGYGAQVRLEPPAQVLVAAGGYADGLHRTIGKNGVGEVAGKLLPIVGRISMDTTLFNASALDGIELAEELMIEVCNDRLTVDVLAERSGALGYEVLTSLGARYQRRYLPPDDSAVNGLQVE